MTEKPEIPTSSGSLVKIGDFLGMEHVGPWGNRIIDSISNAFGRGATFLIGRKEAQHRADEAVIEATGLAKAEAIRQIAAAKIQNVIEHQDELAESVEGRALMRFQTEAFKQQETLEGILKSAVNFSNESESQATIELSSEPVSDEWLEEFKDISKNTTVDSMKELWGKVLANEVRKPGSYSVRSLWTLKNMSSEEAEQFRLACQLYVPALNGIIRVNKEWARGSGEFFGLKYQYLQLMANIGLIMPGFEKTEYPTKINPVSYVQVDLGESIYAISNASDTEINCTWDTIPFSPVGKELANLVDRTPPAEYVAALEALCKENGLELYLEEDIKKLK